MVRRKRQFIDFGFDPSESPHHFAVILQKEKDTPVIIEERFESEQTVAPAGAKSAVAKVRLDSYRWERIAEPARAEFNKRIRAAGHRSVSWETRRESLIAPHFGKELTLLAWAVEDMDESLIPNVIANWIGLEPEERWWLYTTVNATFTIADVGKDRGWRKAIKIAFSENPVPEMAGERFVEEPEPIKLPQKEDIPKNEPIATARTPKKRKRATPKSPRQASLFENA
jgi:hypothetical protein